MTDLAIPRLIAVVTGLA